MKVANIAAVLLCCLFGFLSQASAATVPSPGSVVGATSYTGSISGRVIDANTGLPLSGAVVTASGPVTASAKSGADGTFAISGLTPGGYVLRIILRGYQSSLSEQIAISAGVNQDVTLSLARAATGTEAIRTLGRTTIRASQSLQRSAIIVKQQSVEVIESQGTYRVGDFLRTLPQVNVSAATGGSDTPAPGDDLYFDIRGIGGLETEALIDGHPIGFGINRGKNLGYNFEVSPTFALRSIQVTYGSGVAGLTPYSAVGGVIDMLTLEPTPRSEANITEGWGTFNKLVTSFNATGTNDRLGYALALGTQGIDGPYKNEHFFQPASAFDPSAPAGTVAHDSGIYKDDTSVVNRGDFLKLRWALGDINNPGHLTLSAVDAYYWDDKTGNGDQDFLPFDTALALGNQSLASYSGPCPKGQFTPTNANGAPWGTGPNGLPDGGKSCVTPQQFASIASGFQGAGPTWQSFTMSDYNFRYDQPIGKSTLTLDAFTNHWFQIYDRTYQLPFNSTFGDNPFWLSPSVNTTGEYITDMFNGNKNDIGVGFATNNYAYLFSQNGKKQPSPLVHDDTIYMQDIYHPTASGLKVYLNAAEVHSSITDSTYFDPRVALVQPLGNHDILRFASGVTTVEPYATYLALPYSPIAQGALNGNLNCAGLTTIGQVADPNLLPERANDQELSLGHNFADDSQIQFTVYSENVNNKIYSTIIPVFGLPAGIIPAQTLQNFETAINAACGTSGLTGVGVNSNANVGRLLAQGIDLNGRQRVSRQLFFDYDYSVESTALESADVTTLQNNPTLIVRSQLPGVPLHKGQIALDATFLGDLDFRLTQTFISANNSKNSPAYNWGDLLISAALPHFNSTVHLGVSNVFNQDAQYNGLIGHGYRLPLNQYASPGQYAPLIGTAATELYGVPYRQLFISYTYHMH